MFLRAAFSILPDFSFTFCPAFFMAALLLVSLASSQPNGIVGVLFGGWPIFHEAFENLLERFMMMELSMTIALAGAIVENYALLAFCRDCLHER